MMGCLDDMMRGLDAISGCLNAPGHAPRRMLKMLRKSIESIENKKPSQPTASQNEAKHEITMILVSESVFCCFRIGRMRFVFLRCLLCFGVG